MFFTEVFQIAVKRGASDIHLACGYPPMARVDGVLVPLSKSPLSEGEVTKLIKQVLGETRWKQFVTEEELDTAFERGDHRLRVNAHFSRGEPALAARLVPRLIPSLEEIGLSEIAPRLLDPGRGLILLTGPAGTGKSTALAAMLEWLNQNRALHIVTLEDPIEFIFSEAKGLVKQREVGIDTHSFAEGLRHALRQDPDVIMVGEMRDPETIAAALTLAETGHLVFSTLHTRSAAQAVYRIVDSFDGRQQEQVRRQLSLSLRGVVAQTLLPRVGGGRVAAREVLLNNTAAANIIRENKIEQLPSVIVTGVSEGMIPMERSIKDLLRAGLISEETAEEQKELFSTSRR